MNEEARSAEVLVRQALEPQNLSKLKTDPEGTLRSLEANILQRPRVMEQDKVVYRIVIGALSTLALSVAGTAIYLSIANNGDVQKFPDILTALGSASLGALAGILSPNGRG